jgi:hypothetical protein
METMDDKMKILLAEFILEISKLSDTNEIDSIKSELIYDSVYFQGDYVFTNTPIKKEFTITFNI